MTSSNKSVGIQGKILHSQTREVIANVLEFMEEEAKNGIQIPITNFKRRLMMATRIGEYSYRKILLERQMIKTGLIASFSTPGKNRNRRSPKSDVSEEVSEGIRAIIDDFRLVENRKPTLKEIYKKIMESGLEFKGGVSTLAKVIKKMESRKQIVDPLDDMFFDCADLVKVETGDSNNVKVEELDLKCEMYEN